MCSCYHASYQPSWEQEGGLPLKGWRRAPETGCAWALLPPGPAYHCLWGALHLRTPPGCYPHCCSCVAGPPAYYPLSVMFRTLLLLNQRSSWTSVHYKIIVNKWILVRSILILSDAAPETHCKIIRLRQAAQHQHCRTGPAKSASRRKWNAQETGNKSWCSWGWGSGGQKAAEKELSDKRH